MGDSMSSIVVSGDTSGAITLQAPAVAGTNTLSLPAVTGTVLTDKYAGTVLQVVSALAVIILVLLQQGKGADMGAAFGSGASGSLFGASGGANFLSRTTAVISFSPPGFIIT